MRQCVLALLGIACEGRGVHQRSASGSLYDSNDNDRFQHSDASPFKAAASLLTSLDPASAFNSIGVPRVPSLMTPRQVVMEKRRDDQREELENDWEASTYVTRSDGTTDFDQSKGSVAGWPSYDPYGGGKGLDGGWLYKRPVRGLDYKTPDYNGEEWEGYPEKGMVYKNPITGQDTRMYRDKWFHFDTTYNYSGKQINYFMSDKLAPRPSWEPQPYDGTSWYTQKPSWSIMPGQKTTKKREATYWGPGIHIEYCVQDPHYQDYYAVLHEVLQRLCCGRLMIYVNKQRYLKAESKQSRHRGYQPAKYPRYSSFEVSDIKTETLLWSKLETGKHMFDDRKTITELMEDPTILQVVEDMKELHYADDEGIMDRNFDWVRYKDHKWGAPFTHRQYRDYWRVRSEEWHLDSYRSHKDRKTDWGPKPLGQVPGWAGLSDDVQHMW